jgi:hypothetical protein
MLRFSLFLYSWVLDPLMSNGKNNNNKKTNVWKRALLKEVILAFLVEDK